MAAAPVVPLVAEALVVLRLLAEGVPPSRCSRRQENILHGHKRQKVHTPVDVISSGILNIQTIESIEKHRFHVSFDLLIHEFVVYAVLSHYSN